MLGFLSESQIHADYWITLIRIIVIMEIYAATRNDYKLELLSDLINLL